MRDRIPITDLLEELTDILGPFQAKEDDDLMYVWNDTNVWVWSKNKGWEHAEELK
jgi:hypothetical protein